MAGADLALANLTHPAILAVMLGIIAVPVRSDLHIPKTAAKLLSSYLLLAIGMPIAAWALGVVLGAMAGLSVGGAAVFGAMAGSASYLAAPAAVQVSLPKANRGLALTASLAITLPFNLALGIPIHHSNATAVA